MEDGGLDLKKYIRSLKNNTTVKSKLNRLWLELRRMLYGVKLFQMHDIMHHDIKYENIVYDEKKTRASFIDFGLMQALRKSMKQCRENKFEWNIYHWSYPFETSIIQQDTYEALQTMDIGTRTEQVFQELRQITEEDDNFMNVFFDQIGVTEKKEKYTHIDRYVNFLINGIVGLSYEAFLNKHFYTMDVYGLGVALLQLLKDSKRFMTDAVVKSGKELFMQMVDPNLNTRLTIDKTIDEYEKWLKESGIVTSQTSLPEIILGQISNKSRSKRTLQKKPITNIVKALSITKRKRKKLVAEDPQPNTYSNEL